MRKYWAVLRLSVKSAFTYRWGVFLEVIAEIVASFFAILIWQYIGAGKGVGDFSQEQLLSYLVIAGFVVSTIHVANSGDAVNDAIKDGELSLLLTKPWHMAPVFFMQSLGERVLMMGSAIVGYGVVILALHIPVFQHITFMGFLQALPFLVFSILLQFLMFHAVAFLAFWLHETWGPRLLIRVIMEIGSGALIPINLLHPTWRGLFAWLPFRFLGDLPALALLGKLPVGEYVQMLALGCVWIAVGLVVYAVIWTKGVRSYEAVGS